MRNYQEMNKSKLNKKRKERNQLELKEAKEDLWKLKGKEKKIVSQTPLQ